MNDAFHKIITALNNEGIAVVRTDTLYGIIAKADSEAAVEKVFDAKHRQRSKQCIILIADAGDVPAYQTEIAAHSQASDTPTSVIVPASSEPEWLLRGGTTIAYRVVQDPFLKSVVEAVGPVIAPSANPEGLEPANSILKAKDYFGDIVDCYVDGGEVPSDVRASQIIEVHSDGTTTIIRSR